MNKLATKTKNDVDELIDRIKQKTGLTQEEIAKKINYNRSYLSQAKTKDSEKLYSVLYGAFKDVLENITNEEVPNIEHTPAMQAILNLTYASRKTADGIDKMADANVMNARSIETLVMIVAANLGVSGLKGLSPADLQTGDVPVEAFLGGRPLGSSKSDDKKKKEHK